MSSEPTAEDLVMNHHGSRFHSSGHGLHAALAPRWPIASALAEGRASLNRRANLGPIRPSPFILPFPFPDLVPDVSHSASPIVRPGLQPPHHPRHINRAGPDIVVPPDPHRTETGTAAICAGAMQNTARGWDACTKDHLDLIDHSTFRTEDLRDTAESPADPGMPLACGPGI